MNDRYRIDGHKLIYHPERVARFLAAGDDWEQAKAVYPLYVELSPIGACNHRCTFCALDYMGYQPLRLDTKMIGARLAEMAALGVRSVHLAGEGEPLLHTGIVEIIDAAARAGLDIGITTNATVMSDGFIEQALGQLQWIKASINAGTPATYLRIHRGKPRDFDKAIDNLARAVDAKHARNLAVTLGAQAVLLPENAAEMVTLAELCRDRIGLDYLVVKPYSQHGYSLTHDYEALDYAPFMRLAEELETLNTGGFQVVFRANTMHKHQQPIAERYTTCYATPSFWAYVASNGDLYSCSAHLSNPRFALGNLAEEGFGALWEGEQRRRNFEYVRNALDISECRRNCRMDEINRYLSDLVEGRVPHVNFI